jgi:Mg2+ and Co2+ transporter CorA
MTKTFPIVPLRGRDAAEHITKDGFVWVDLAHSDFEACADELGKALELTPDVITKLGTLEAEASDVRRPDVHPNAVAFPVWAWNQDPWSDEQGPVADRPDTYQVNVLIHGCALVTVTEDQSHPPFVDADGLPAQSEAHAIYLILSSIFDSHTAELGRILDQMSDIDNHGQEGLFQRLGGQNAIARLRTDLTELRKAVGPERRLFDRLGVEIESVEGLSSDHTDHIQRLHDQLDHIDDGIAAVSGALSDLIGLRISAIGFSLTALATILTPIAVITGLLGVDWVHNQLDTTAAGIGLIILIVALSLFTGYWIRRLWAVDPTDEQRRIRRLRARALHKPGPGGG